MSRHCTNCGNPVAKATHFCTDCGTKCATQGTLASRLPSYALSPHNRAWALVIFSSLWLVFFYGAAGTDRNADAGFLFLVYAAGAVGLYRGIRRLTSLSKRKIKMWPWALALIFCIVAYEFVRTQSDYEECRRAQFGGYNANSNDYFFAPGYAGETCSAEVIARRFH